MIVVHIICTTKTQAEEILEMLIMESLIYNAMVSEKIIYEKKSPKTLASSKQILVTAKTKSLLFQSINDRLRETQGNHMPMLYCLPVVYMDPDQAQQLLKETIKI
ncbi:MAG: divalent cation tolerance protein CutA [Saonia sp.]